MLNDERDTQVLEISEEEFLEATKSKEGMIKLAAIIDFFFPGENIYLI